MPLNKQQEPVEFGRFRLDPSERQLLRDGHAVRLQPKVFDTLLVLVRNAGHLLTKDDLMKEIWGDTVVEETGLARVLTELRKVLGEGYIETIPKHGYRFVLVAQVAPANKTTAEDGHEDLHMTGHDSAPILSAERASDGGLPGQPTKEESQPMRQADEGVILNGRPDEKEGSPADADNPGEPSSTQMKSQTGRGARYAVSDVPSIDAKLIAAIVVIGVSLLVLPYVAGVPRDWAKIFASTLHLLVILYAFTYTQRGPKRLGSIEPEEEGKIRKDSGYDNEKDWLDAKEIAEVSLKSYTTYWYGLLISWYLLYVVLTFLWRYDPLDHPILEVELSLRIGATLFNNCNSLMLALGYVILSKFTVIRRESRNISRAPSIRWLVIVLTVVTVIETSLALSAANEKGYLMNRANVLEGFDWISGIFGGVALALYVGRLQSRFLGPPDWLLTLLYSYTAIQPLYALLGRDKQAAIFIMSAALVLKTLLCVYTIRLFQTGKLLFYFVRARRTEEAVKNQWNEFRKLLR